MEKQTKIQELMLRYASLPVADIEDIETAMDIENQLSQCGVSRVLASDGEAPYPTSCWTDGKTFLQKVSPGGSVRRQSSLANIKKIIARLEHE